MYCINFMIKTFFSSTHDGCVFVTPGQFWPLGIVFAYIFRPSVHLSVRHQVCPHDNSSPIQARITKFGSEVQNTLIKIPIVLAGQVTLP